MRWHAQALDKGGAFAWPESDSERAAQSEVVASMRPELVSTSQHYEEKSSASAVAQAARAQKKDEEKAVTLKFHQDMARKRLPDLERLGEKLLRPFLVRERDPKAYGYGLFGRNRREVLDRQQNRVIDELLEARAFVRDGTPPKGDWAWAPVRKTPKAQTPRSGGGSGRRGGSGNRYSRRRGLTGEDVAGR
jgi:hypothetical protein